MDKTALSLCKNLLGQVQIILQKLDYDNSLVFSCSRYISNMLEVCTAQGMCNCLPRTHEPDPKKRRNPRGLTKLLKSDTTVMVSNEEPDKSSMIRPRFDPQPSSASAPNPLETMMHLGIEDTEMFHLYSSEIYDLDLFQGLDRPSSVSKNIE